MHLRTHDATLYIFSGTYTHTHTLDALTLDGASGTVCTKEKDRREMSVDQARRFSFEY